MTSGITSALSGNPARVVTLNGAQFNVADDKPTFWDKAEAGLWEPETIEALGKLLGPGTVLIDIGAWVGPLTLLAAARGAHVVAVEADHRALELLEGNLAANPDIAQLVQVIPRAASATPGQVRLASPRKPGDSMASVLQGKSPTSWTTPSVSPADLMDHAQGAGSGPIIIKMDIEGGEYDLLPSLVAAFPDRVAALFAAFHPRELAASGRTWDEVRHLTQQCASIFAGWDASVLDSGYGPTDDPFAIASRDDVTVMLVRRTPRLPISRVQN